MLTIKRYYTPIAILVAFTLAFAGTAFTMVSANDAGSTTLESIEAESEQFDFAAERSEILEEVEEVLNEFNIVFDEADYETLSTLKDELYQTEDEDDFFAILDEMYEIAEPYIFAIEQPDAVAEVAEVIIELADEFSSVELAELERLADELEDITDVDMFYDLLDEFYDIADPVVFVYERPEILEDIDTVLTELADEFDADELRDLEALKTELEATTDEDDFFNLLDEFYEIADPVIEVEWDDFDFTQERTDILSETELIIAEISSDLSASERAEIDDLFAVLMTTTDEDDFFDTLDEIYEIVEPIFEDEWDDYDYDEEREYILEDVSAVLEELADEFDEDDLRELIALQAQMQATTDEDDFFDLADEVFDLIDPVLETLWDDFEDEWEDEWDEEDFEDYDFDEEREDIIDEAHEVLEEIEEELSTSDRSELQALIAEMEATTGEDEFFELEDEFFEIAEEILEDIWDDEDEEWDDEWDEDDEDDEDFEDEDDEDDHHDDDEDEDEDDE